MKFRFVDQKEKLIRDTHLRDIKISTAYQFLREYTDFKYAQIIDILSKEFYLSDQGIKNIIQKMKRKQNERQNLFKWLINKRKKLF